MTERKPARETWESFTERKIREAQDEGAFAHLPGMGKPIAGIGNPLDENWWVREKLRREKLSVLPPALEVRLETEKTLAALPDISSEHEVRRRLEKLNQKIRDAHYSPLPGPPVAVNPIDVEAEIGRWREARRKTADRR